MYLQISVYLFFVGLFFGSFFGVLVDRTPFGKNFITGRSVCDHCKKPLKWYDLFPILSFFLLQGKCRYCKTHLSYFYPTIELLTGALFAFTNYRFSLSSPIQLIFDLYIISTFIIVVFADLKYKLIPNLVVYPAVLITGVYYLLGFSVFTNHLLSAFGALAFFLSLFLITRGKGMGFGDVQLSFLLGLLLGFPNIVLGLYVAFLTGAVISIILIVVQKYSLKHAVPFGPFLILGSLVAWFWGEKLLSLFPYL